MYFKADIYFVCVLQIYLIYIHKSRSLRAKS